MYLIWLKTDVLFPIFVNSFLWLYVRNSCIIFCQFILFVLCNLYIMMTADLRERV